MLRGNNRNIETQAEDRANYFPDYYYCDDGNEVTVTAKFWFVNDFDGGQANAEAVVDMFVATTNEALSNSKVPITYQKWGSVQQHPMTNDELSSVKLGTYPDEDGNYIASNSLFADSLGTDMEDYAFLRQTADHVVLLYNNLVNEPNRCWGFSTYMGTGSESYSTIWTIIVNGALDDDSALIFAHEAGHCMGAMHNIEVWKVFLYYCIWPLCISNMMILIPYKSYFKCYISSINIIYFPHN